MKRLIFALCVIVLVSVAPRPASAAPITIVDPIIGVRGGNFGSLDPTDPSFNAFADCSPFAADLAAAGFECLVYRVNEAFNLPTNGLRNLVLQIQDLAGANATTFVQDPGGTCDYYVECIPRPGSQFQVIDRFEGGLVEFRGFEEEALTCFDGETETVSNCVDAIIYIKPLPGESLHFQSAVREVNGNPVPEPGTLLLMGTGIASVVGRRLRRNAKS